MSKIMEIRALKIYLNIFTTFIICYNLYDIPICDDTMIVEIYVKYTVEYSYMTRGA